MRSKASHLTDEQATGEADRGGIGGRHRRRYSLGRPPHGAAAPPQQRRRHGGRVRRREQATAAAAAALVRLGGQVPQHALERRQRMLELLHPGRAPQKLRWMRLRRCTCVRPTCPSGFVQGDRRLCLSHLAWVTSLGSPRNPDRHVSRTHVRRVLVHFVCSKARMQDTLRPESALVYSPPGSGSLATTHMLFVAISTDALPSLDH